MIDVSKIDHCRIHPGIGIARLGNSLKEFFIGPEAPGEVANAGRTFKDASGRVKRQAARFRIYAFDAAGNAIDEVTLTDAKIEWQVHLANKKGAWFKFLGRFRSQKVLRNGAIQGGPEFQTNPDLRSELIIDPGARSIGGASQGPVTLDGGRFLGVEVPLGELRTDAAGRLLVLGGFGHSDVTQDGKPITTFANNDFWYDDTSDGPVTATVTFGDGRSAKSFPVTAARVLVTPPKFAPGLENIVSLYELIRDVSVGAPSPTAVEFYRDVYPILRRPSGYTWVNNEAHRGHGPTSSGDFLTDSTLKLLAAPKSAEGAALRTAIFSRMRVPAAKADEQTRQAQAHLHFMPALSGDKGDATDGDPDTWLTLLPSQYEILAAWAKGEFVTGTPEPLLAFDRIPTADRPAALDKAALLPCVGGPFFPGIEMTYIASDKTLYAGPFRLDPALPPGAITRWMAVPWQADFYQCAQHWWPVQRPDDVVQEADFDDLINQGGFPANQDSEGPERYAVALGSRVPWARGLPDAPAGDNDMVRYWSELGFVVPKETPTGETVHIETERAPLVGLNARDLFYALMNIDDHPECLPKARAFVDAGLAWAEQYSNDPATPHSDRFFPYSEGAFQARLDEIYHELVAYVAASTPQSNVLFKTREDMAIRTKQLAPFNLTDGAWLRNIGTTGPIDNVRALLYSVAMDEMGDGEVSQNHCNLYRDLCHQVGYYPAPLNSRDFVYDPELLDSAFTIPTFELAISQFSSSYYPEILGMTLQLEWTVVDLKPTRDLLEFFGLDSHYYVMHIGIDNAVNGHGQRAVEAVRLYLEQVRAGGGGEEAVQHQWRRIWNGFIAFGNLGTFFSDLADLITNRPSLRDQLVAMIAAKGEYGKFNHDQHRLGPNLINEWFADPDAMLDALVKFGKLKPGDWEGSPMAQLTSFATGPMYRVFSEDELQLWAEYTRSLAAPPAPQPQPGPSPGPLPQTDPARAMAQVIDLLRPQQSGTAGHQHEQLNDADGTAHPVAWWFTQPTRAFMEALANPANGWITPGNPDGSRFITELVDANSTMGWAFVQPAPDGSGTCRDVVHGWIAAGCPLPPATQFIAKLRMNSPQAVWDSHPTGRLVGMGTVH